VKLAYGSYHIGQSWNWDIILMSCILRKTYVRTLSVLTQNPHPAPNTQQAEKAGLTHEQIPKRPVNFPEINKG
jgi:hypothetical protein